MITEKNYYNYGYVGFTTVSPLSQTVNEYYEMVHDTKVVYDSDNESDIKIEDCRVENEIYYFCNWKKFAIWNRIENTRCPLTIATAKGLQWREGLSNIFQATDTQDIEMHDPITGLDTFMLAATSSGSNLETVYQLLHKYPSIMNIYSTASNNKDNKKFGGCGSQTKSLDVVHHDITTIKTKRNVRHYPFNGLELRRLRNIIVHRYHMLDKILEKYKRDKFSFLNLNSLSLYICLPFLFHSS